MNQTSEIFKRINADTIFDKHKQFSIGYDTKLEIAQLVHKRTVNRISQKQMSEMCEVGVATIKRFESYKVDSLVLFNDYKHFLSHLHSNKKPNWI